MKTETKQSASTPALSIAGIRDALSRLVGGLSRKRTESVSSYRQLVRAMSQGRQVDLEPDAIAELLVKAGKTEGDLQSEVEHELQRRELLAKIAAETSATDQEAAALAERRRDVGERLARARQAFQQAQRDMESLEWAERQHGERMAGILEMKSQLQSYIDNDTSSEVKELTKEIKALMRKKAEMQESYERHQAAYEGPLTQNAQSKLPNAKEYLAGYHEEMRRRREAMAAIDEQIKEIQQCQRELAQESINRD